MRGTLKGSDLAAAVDQIKNVVELRQTLPILGCVLIEMHTNGSVSFTATDLEEAARVEIEAGVETPGAVAVPAAKLAPLAAAVKNDTVLISTGDGGTATIKAGTGVWRLVGMSADDFPPMGDIKGAELQVSAPLLAAAFQRIAYAISRDTTRYNICGAQVRLRAGEARAEISATDGHRLTRVFAPLETPPAATVDMIVPGDAIKTLIGLLKSQSALATLTCDTNAIAVTVNKIRWRARLVEGQFPNADQILKGVEEHPYRVTVDAAMLRDLIGKVVFLAEDRNRPVKMAFSDKGLTLTASSPDAGDAEITAPVEWRGPEITIALNSTYLREYLDVAGKLAVELRLKDATSPLYATAEGAPSYVVMPMRL